MSRFRSCGLAFLIVFAACTPASHGRDAGTDAGDQADAGVGDANQPEDAGLSDAGTDDAGTDDAGTDDAGTVDSGTDAGQMEDAGSVDAGQQTDAGQDAGPGDGTPPTVMGPPNNVTLNEDGTVTIPIAVGGVEAGVPCEDLLTVTSSDAALLPTANPRFEGAVPECTLEITPAANVFGSGSLVVTVHDGAASAQTTIQVEVTSVNDAPRFEFPDGFYRLNEDQVNPPPFTFLISDDGAIGCNDLVMAPTTQANALVTSLTLTAGANSGECVVQAQLVPNAFGSGTVWLTLTDRDGVAVEDGFTLRVTAVNDPPTITLSSDHLAVLEDAADRATFLFSVADSDGAAECSATTATALDGAVPLVSEFDVVATSQGINFCRLTVFFVPGATGEGTIELVTSDNLGLTATASFTLRVIEVGDPPVFAPPPADIYTLEDMPGPLTSTFKVVDPDGVVDCSDVTAVDGFNPSHTSSITITDDGTGTCVVSVQLAPNMNGDDPILLTVTDDSTQTATATLTLHVASSIDLPQIIVDTSEIVTLEDGPNPVVPFTVIDVEHPGTMLDCKTAVTVDLLSGTGGLVIGFQVDYGMVPGDCLLTIQLGANANGTANVRLFVTDATPRTRTVVLPLRVTAVGDAPQATFDANPVTTAEDTPFFFYFNLIDIDRDPVPGCVAGVSASSAGAPSGLIDSLVVSATAINGICKLTVTPGANAHGSGPITLTVTGTDGLQSTSSVTLVVTSVSDGLTISDTGNQTTNEDVPVTVSVTIAGDGLIECDPAHLSGTGDGLSFAFSGTPADCRVTITPSHNQSGTVTVQLTAFDGTLQASDTFDLVISPVEDDMCLPDNGNGGCGQRCLASVNEVATCGCFPGFALKADGKSCDPTGAVTLLNVGLGRFFDVTSTGPAPRVLGLRAVGRPVKMAQIPGRNDTFTFTVRETPGTCADGSTSAACVDSYRLCADSFGGFNVRTVWSSQHSGTPSAWDSASCAWIVKDIGGGHIRLKNQGLQQTNPYLGYLVCAQANQCAFTYDNAVTGNTAFRIDAEKCAAGTANCDANATCANTPVGATCTCNPHFAGTGTTCAPIDACAISNGGCAQRCVGTAANDSAICTCAPGFDLASDGKACTPRAENRLYNTGLGLFLSLPPAPSLAFFADVGSNVRVAPLPGSTKTFTFTVESPGISYRLCTHDFGGFQAYGLPWSAGNAAPSEWDSSACGWNLTDAGNGQVRLRSAWLEETNAGYGYLNCLNAFQCSFTLGTDTNGNTLFSIDQDECAAGANTCDTHADCTNTIGGYQCACSAGYDGNGQSCVLTNVCEIDNGGCSQKCVGTAADGSGICACFPGGVLNADRASCAPVDGGRLYNTGLAEFIALRTSFPAPYRFIFDAIGDDVKVRPAATGGSDKTLDMEYRPGTCANGTISNACPDTYRMCVVNEGGFRLGLKRSNAQDGDPADWNGTACAWRLEEVGENQVRLKNVWMQTDFPQIDYLQCNDSQDCGFTLEEATTNYTQFVLDIDECDIGADTCDPNANCANTIGSFTCTCRDGFVADGDRCLLVDSCVVDNGGCGQLCTGTEAGQGVCGCFPGFTLGADGRSCEPAQRMRLLNDGVGYLDLATQGPSPYLVSLSANGRGVAVDPVPGTHDRFTVSMAFAPGHCADGSTNVFCPDLYRLCAANIGGIRLDRLMRDARVGDPAGWNDAQCQWIFEQVGNDQFRMKNVWLQEEPTLNHLDYLDCGTANGCMFTLNEETEGHTLFTLDVDKCADGSAGCDANATCTDTRDSAVCTCEEGYAGSGLSCALENVCVVRNGGCQQECLGTVAGAAVCGCYPGFALGADGSTCTARPALRLYNVGVGDYLDWERGPGIGQLGFSPAGRTVRMEKTLDGPDTFTFTVEVTPGTCANGSSRDQCPNLYRMCAQDYSGFRWKTELRSDYGGGKPALWDAPECKWKVEDLGTGRVRLRNLWLQERHPYLSNLICTGDGTDCFFNYGTDTSANSTFAVYTDECSTAAPVCDAHATCSNLAGVDTCVCNEKWAGDGTSCLPTDRCVVGNGGCQQSCADTGDAVSCGCWGGFDPSPDGTSCVPWPNVRLVSGAFGLKATWDDSHGLRFDGVGQPIRVEASPIVANAVTLTMDVAASDEVRICAGHPSGFSWYPSRRSAGDPAPADWNGAECTWLVEGSDAGAVRLRSLWIEQEYPQFDYLECWNSAACSFTYLDEKTPQSVFYLQSDQCAAAENACGANATCANTANSHTCTCDPGYVGDGQTCVLVDACVQENGGCAQRCTHSDTGAICGCFPGFVLNIDGQSCAPMATVKLLNEGFGQFIDVADSGELELLSGAGADVQVAAVEGSPNLYTFTVNYGDEYRLCAWDYSGYRTITLRRGMTDPTPDGWDGPACQWSIVPAGGNRMRLKNEWLQQEHPYADYLDCRTPYDWTFTYDESTAGNTVFAVDADECALGTDMCSPNATCTNTAGGYDCACNARFTGDGVTCTPDGPCVIDNGGCAQTCSEVGGNAVCGCYPGFNVGFDPATCTSAGTVVLYNVGHGKSLNLGTSSGLKAPYAFEFAQQGRGLRMEKAPDARHDTFTFTFDYTPGTCADGSTSIECTDQYRMCAGNDSGFRWIETWQHAGEPLPVGWNGPECTWIVENASDGQLHLRNLLLSKTYSYVDYLSCRVPYDCGFTGDDSTPPNATFRVLRDVCVGSNNLCELPRTCLNNNAGDGYVCSACPDGYTTNGAYACTDIDECQWTECGDNAYCHNFGGGAECVCDDGLVGDGETCAQPGECATNNGDCAQICSADANGTAVCGCYPGFTLSANGKACVSVGDVNVGNVELGLWLAIDTQFNVPYRFEFRADPARVKMEQVAGAHDKFTFTAQYTPGTCGDACVDQYRMCLLEQSGFRLGRIWRGSGAAAPTDWTSTKCQWEVRRAGEGQLRLRNVFLQEQGFGYTEYLACPTATSCSFNYDESGAGNTTFRVNEVGHDLCYGVTCVAKDQCHAPGVCFPLSGLCSDPVLPVGTACDDGNSAVTGDTCSSGVCVNGGDRDGDGVANSVDLCVGDDATGDTDSDGRCNDSDNCPSIANPSQPDRDRDGFGDACDNCPNTTATSQEDADHDGVGNVCDPDYRPPSPGADPGQTYNGGNPGRPACGFTPICPGASGATKFNSYLFGCYADEPNGGTSCLGDRWWHHLSRRIYPALLTTTEPGTVDGTLNELAKPENNQPAVSCPNDAACTAPATCLGGVCTMPAVKDFIDRLSESSNFLSCTGPGSFENTWPADRVIPLDTGGCDPLAEYYRIYGYRVSNTTATPMTIWVTKERGKDGKWWTINPGEEIRFNAFGGALLFATTAEAYRVCQPGFMTKKVTTVNLHQLIAGQPGYGQIRVPQTTPEELVRYTVAASGGGGSLIITRDRELTLDVHLYVYPNYFGVGTPPYPQYSTSDIEQLIVTLARNVNGFNPVKEGGLRVISPDRYPVLECTP